MKRMNGKRARAAGAFGVIVLASGTLALMAFSQTSGNQVASSSCVSGSPQCCTADANDQPSGCVPIDPGRFGFAALRGM